MEAPLGLLGGTFDPVHHGHLRPALEMVQGIGLHRVFFIPNYHPPHRPPPILPGAVRLHLLNLAIATEPRFEADSRELERGGISYTIDTLLSFRRQYPHRPLCLLMGFDAFLGLSSWRHWEQFLDLAHIVVANRPPWRAVEDDLMADFLARHRAELPGELHDSSQGRIHLFSVTPLEISSTQIRQEIAQGGSSRYLLPEPVWHHICQERLYEQPCDE